MPRASAIFSKIPDVAVTGCLNSRWNRGADACPLASRCDFSTGTCCGDRRQCMPALHRLSISIEPGHRSARKRNPSASPGGDPRSPSSARRQTDRHWENCTPAAIERAEKFLYTVAVSILAVGGGWSYGCKGLSAASAHATCRCRSARPPRPLSARCRAPGNPVGLRSPR
jgi:hypothetical protein